MAKQSLVLMFFTLCLHIGYSKKSYNIQQYCDKSISMMDDGEKSAVLYYTHKLRLRDRFFDMECTVRISGWVENDILFQLTTFDVESSKTTVEIRQGDTWRSAEPIVGLPRGFLSKSQLNVVFTTYWWTLYIRIKGKAPKGGARIFAMKLNVFHRGSCFSWENRCDNGRCIDKDLTCKGDNPCGDNSDCLDGGGHTKIIIMVSCIASTFLVFAIICKLTVYCCNRSRKRQNGSVTQPVTADLDGRDQPLTVNNDNINNTNTAHGPVNYTTLLLSDVTHVSGIPDNDEDGLSQVEPPPSYTSVISNDLSDSLSDHSDSDAPPAPPDYNSAVSAGDSHQDRRHFRRPRRPAQRHSSRYLPRYSEVLRNRDAYEVRGEDKTES